MAKKSKSSRADVLTGQAVLDLRKDLYATWKEVTTAGEVDTESFRKFFKPFIRYAETLLKIEIEKLSRLPLQAVFSKVNGFWPDGRPEGNGLRVDVLARIAPQPPFQNALRRLMELRLSNPHFFDESRKSVQLPAAFVKAAADVGIENDSNIFEVLRSLPQVYLGDWFRHLSDTWGMSRTSASGGATKSADVCRDFSLVMLDFGVWHEFFDVAFGALRIHSDNLLNERALREMELRARPRRRNLDPVWERAMVEILASERRNREACASLDARKIGLPPSVSWKDKDGRPAACWVKSFDGSRATVEAYLSKFRKRHAK